MKRRSEAHNYRILRIYMLMGQQMTTGSKVLSQNDSVCWPNWFGGAMHMPWWNSMCLRCVLHEVLTILCYCAFQHEFDDNACEVDWGVECCTFNGKYNSSGYHQKWPLTCSIFCPLLINIYKQFFWLFKIQWRSLFKWLKTRHQTFIRLGDNVFSINKTRETNNIVTIAHTNAE